MHQGLSDAIYSPIRIVQDADPLVQAIIALLLLASILSWSIIIDRTWRIVREQRRIRSVRASLSTVGTQADLDRLNSENDGHVVHILRAIETEWRWSSDNRIHGYGQVHERLISSAELALLRESRLLTGATSWLATISTSAPFIGLFGTVWGIMSSFLAIAQTQDTSLVAIAPGIAEALLATGVGLFCAIPAVIGYNRLLQNLGRIDAEWRSIAGILEIAISRHFGRGL